MVLNGEMMLHVICSGKGNRVKIGQKKNPKT